MRTGFALGVLMSAAVAAGCGSGPATPATSSPTVPTAAATPSAATAPPSQAAGPVINVTIAAGVVTPTNAEVEAAVGQPIVLEVSSDATDSIHVHSIPERVFDVQPLPGQRFEFTVGIPGRVDVELHDLNRTVVTVAVKP
ncbi:hypothetical protein [Mycolicibacterium sp.]|uniref:hypothetical protein n=1 Tax=Mycolicibacterium sp. TaxID=2320850 RepID=UPI0028AA328E|nr:hypothetical protein [Mycolicibacterium sp.]